MGNFNGFIYLFLVAFGARACMAQPGAKSDNKAELDKLYKNLEGQAAYEAKNIDKVHDPIASIMKRHLDLLVVTAGNIDVSECIAIADPLYAELAEITEKGKESIYGILEEAKKEFATFDEASDMAAVRHKCTIYETRMEQSSTASREALLAFSLRSDKKGNEIVLCVIKKVNPIFG